MMKLLDHKGSQVVYYQDGTAGIALVLLHGFCEDASVWDGLVEDLKKDFRVIRIDFPGFGRSEARDKISIEEMAEIVERVLSLLNIENCVLIGHSMGGYVSLAFAEKFGTYLKGLGMFHSHPAADTAEKKEGRNKSIDFVNKNGSILYVKQLIPKFFAPDFLKDNALLVDGLIHKASNYSAVGLTASLEAMRNRPDRSEVLEQLPCPALFIIGREDIAVPPGPSMEQTHLPDISAIHIFPKVGHMGMFEARKSCLAIIQDFSEFCYT